MLNQETPNGGSSVCVCARAYVCVCACMHACAFPLLFLVNMKLMLKAQSHVWYEV
jgi:hypothetical protein